MEWYKRDSDPRVGPATRRKLLRDVDRVKVEHKISQTLLFLKKNWTIPASFSVYFRLFNMSQLKFKFKLIKAYVVCLGFESGCCKMEGADESTELWRHENRIFSIHPENTDHRGSITVWLTSCLTDLDLTKQVKLLFIPQKQSRWMQTKTGSQWSILPKMAQKWKNKWTPNW